ncbi:MAG: DotU family type IV/VI secretion system protein [Methylococcaceae bacterium]
MSQALWKNIVTINDILNPLREIKTESVISTIDWLELRSKVRAQLEDLRTTITEHYSERDAYYALFPLTAHCDEWVKKLILDNHQSEWPPLQQELYQVDDAGDLFFELLDNVLSKPETLSLVYEVYYFCLNDGFYGRYSARPDRLDEYLQKLRQHISLQPITAINSPPLEPSRRAYFRIPNYLYYCGTGLLLILVYFFLIDLAGTWHPS